jgi:hypothetical protein
VALTHYSLESLASILQAGVEFGSTLLINNNKKWPVYVCRKTATNRRSDESRTTASARPLKCYIVDDVTRPNMANTEYSLIILSHIVLAKFSITSREIL